MVPSRLKTLLATAALVLAPALTLADDTDVYVDNQASTPPSSRPLVMFSIDYRSNLGSTICTAASRPCNVDNFFITEGFFPFTVRADGVTKVLTSPADGQPITFFDVLRLSLRMVLRETSGYKAGLMLNHNHEANCAGPQSGKRCSNGGYIARRFRSIETVVPPGGTDTDLSRIELLRILDALPPTQGNLSHPFQGTELFYEFFRYLTGQLTYNSSNGWSDYATDSTNNVCLRTGDLGLTGDPTQGSPCQEFGSTGFTNDLTFAGRDTQAATSGSSGERIYNSPLLQSDACTKIFTINFLFQVSSQDNDSNGDIDNARNQGGLGTAIPNAGSFETVIGFLRDADLAPETNKFNGSLSWTFPDNPATPDVNEAQTLGHLPGIQNVTSFFIARPSPEPREGEPEPDTYSFDLTTRTYAVRGGTERPLPLSKDPAVLVNAIRNALQQILSVSTTLVAASVPVNVFNRSEIVDNVYFALFQAQGAGSPEATNVPGGAYYWPGNLKKLRLATTSSGTPEIQDALGQPAIAALDGRILTSSLTYWSRNDLSLMRIGDRNSDSTQDASDGADGDGVANDFTSPFSGNFANPADFTTGRDGRIIARGGAGQRTPGFVDLTGQAGPGDSNPATETGDLTARKVFYLQHSSGGGYLAPLNAVNAVASLDIVRAQLGDPAMASADALRLIRYARGQDVNNEDGDNDTAEARFWIQGDPLHSRPLPLNYGAIATNPDNPDTAGVERSVAFDLNHKNQANPAIFIAMASNDGYLRMFRNTAGTTTGAANNTTDQLGREVWAFMPPEGMAIQQQLANQAAPTGFPAHAYSFDGEPSALVIDQDGDGVIECVGPCDRGPGDDIVVLYVGLRRGQSKYNALNPTSPLANPQGAYYAIDVTEPLNPVFLWRIAPGSRMTSTSTSADTNFAEMGQTFSRPRLGLVKTASNSDGTDVRVLAMFFGGGYDGGYAGSLDAAGQPTRLGNDIDGAMADDAKGKAIFVVRANNGQLLWKATQGSGSPTETHFQHPGLKDSIPSNLTTVDSNADGVVDRIYVGDTGGTVWRADLGNDVDAPNTTGHGKTRDDWKISILAKLGRHAYANPTDTANRVNDRRFFHEPDVIQARDLTGRFDAVVLGTGDRENPLDQGPTTVTSGTDANGQPTTTVTRTSIDVDNWFYMIKDRNVGLGAGTDSTRTHADLTDITNQCLGSSGTCTVGTEGWRLAMDNPNGEKALSAPVTIANSIFFTTYVPPPPSGSGLQFSCGPKEGSGFLYAVKLLTGAPARDYNTTDGPTNPDGSGTTDDDRDKKLDTPGIPAQVVYLGSPATTTGGDRCVVNILAGAQVFEAPGCPRFRTFWERHGQ